MSDAQTAYTAIATRAAHDPAPGPLAEALFPEPVTFRGITLRNPVASDMLLFKRLFPGDTDDEAIFETAWVLSHAPAESRALLARGREVFREQALADVADQLTMSDIPELIAALGKLNLRATSTQVQYAAPAKEGEVFSRPPEAMMTASGGSSMSSAT